MVDAETAAQQSTPGRPSPAALAGLPIKVAARDIVEAHYKHTTRFIQAGGIERQIVALWHGRTLESITTEDMEHLVAVELAAGNSHSTINIKLSFVSKLFDHFKRRLVGVNGQPFHRPDIPWLPKSRTAKWWLNPALEEKVVQWLTDNFFHDHADYVRWTTHSGLRVQETLRLQRMHFQFGGVGRDGVYQTGTLTIPGTKTAAAQRTVPLFRAAEEIALRRFAILSERPDTYLFTFTVPEEKMGTLRRAAMLKEAMASRELSQEDFDDERIARNYAPLREVWNRVRDVFGLQRNKTATVKALRRSFARHATDNGMPTAVLQQYLGHENIQTTMDYLRLVGGYNVDVMRKWVS